MTDPTWTEKIVKKEVARDVMKLGERFGEAVSMVLIFLVFLFFINNQTQDTGLFTSEFGTAEMVLFYGSLLFGLFPPFLRLFLGRRNQVRPVDIIGSVIFVVAASYLLWVFPFDFSHLPDLFPESMRFLIDWVTNDLVMVLMSFAIVIAIIASVWTGFIYILVRESLRQDRSAPISP
jgi:riboflavin transporter FmnP